MVTHVEVASSKLLRFALFCFWKKQFTFFLVANLLIERYGVAGRLPITLKRMETMSAARGE